jgi:hypothetical protein
LTDRGGKLLVGAVGLLIVASVMIAVVGIGLALMLRVPIR